jgi:hypothetical protein
VTSLPLEVEDEYLPIRQKCLRWTEDNLDDLQGDRELTPGDIGNDRARDNWIPLTAIALQCGMLPEAQAACRHLTLQEEDSLTVELLEDIQQIFREENKVKLPSKVLVKKLIAMEERPWAEYRRGKELTQNQLARLLKDFDVHTHQAKVGAKNLKHYRLEDLRPLFARYLKKEPTPVSLNTTATPLPESENPNTSEASEVSGDVAVAASPPENPAAPATKVGVSVVSHDEVADDDALPLPGNATSGHAEQGVTAGSEVAVKNRGKTFSFSRSSSQGGD